MFETGPPASVTFPTYLHCAVFYLRTLSDYNVGMFAQGTMRLLLLKIEFVSSLLLPLTLIFAVTYDASPELLVAVTHTSLAQEGYNYPRPNKPLIPGSNSGDTGGKPRDMYGSIPGGGYPSGRPSNNNGSGGSRGPNDNVPGYPEKPGGYPSNKLEPGYTNGRPTGGRQSEGTTPGSGYNGNGQGPSVGYPKERPSVPFFDGKPSPPGVGKVPGSNPNGPTGPDRSGNQGGGYSPVPTERPGYPRPQNNYLTPSGKPQGPDSGFPNRSPSGQRPDEGFPAPTQGYLSPRPKPGTTQSQGPTSPGYSNGRPGGTPYPGGPGDTPLPGGSTRTPYPGGSPGAPYPGGSTIAPYPGGSTGAPYPGGSPGSSYPGGSPGSSYPGGSTGAPYPGASPGSSYPGGSTGAPYPGGSPGSSYPGGSPGSSYPGGSPGSSYPGGSPGSSYPGGSTGSPYPGGSPGSSYPGGSTGAPYPGGSPGSSYPGGSPGSSYPGGSPGSPFPGGPSRVPYPSDGQRPANVPPTQEPFGGYPGRGQSPGGRPGEQSIPGRFPSGNGQKPSGGPGSQTQSPGYYGQTTNGVKPQPGGEYPGGGQDRPGTIGGFPGQKPIPQGPQQNGFPGGGRGPQDVSRPSGSPNIQGMGGFGPVDGSSGDSKSYGHDDGQYDGDYSAIPGEPGRDYPIYAEIPETSFRCDAQQFPGYYADVEAQCQVFHICANNKTYDFLCPNGTIFHQQFFVCVWWNQFDCNSAPSSYYLNENLYDYTIMGTQGFFGPMLRGPGSLPSGPGQNQIPTQSTETSYPNQGPPTSSRPGDYPGYQQQPGDNYPGKPQPSRPQYTSTEYPSTRPQGPGGSYAPSTRPIPQTPFEGSSTPPSNSYGPPQRPQGPTDSSTYSQRGESSRGYSTPSFGPTSTPQVPSPPRMPQGPNDYSGSPPGYFGTQPYGPPDSQRPSQIPSGQRDRPEPGGPGRYPSSRPGTPNQSIEPSRPGGIPDTSKPNREYLPPRKE